jgi:hypothetical protein
MFTRWFGQTRDKKSSQRRDTSVSRAVKRPRFLPQVEALEERYAPSVTVSLIGGVLTAQCDSGANTVTVDHFGATASINGSSVLDTFYNSILINGGAGGTMSNIHGIVKPLTINGGGTDTVNIGSGGRVTGIQTDITITDPPVGADAAVNVDDSADPEFKHVILDTAAFSNGRITGLTAGSILYRYIDTQAVTIQTGPGPGGIINGAFVEVLATGVPTTLSGHGPTRVDVGNAGSLGGIQAAFSVANIGGLTSTPLTVDDSADTSADRVVTVTSTAVTISGLPVTTINYSAITSLTYNAGPGSSGSNVFDVEGTAAGTSTSLNGGSGNNNTLVGPNAPTGFNITGSNAGTLTSGVSASFSHFQNLTGRSGNDAFIFADGAGVGGNISDIGGAANTLDYSAYIMPVTVNLAAGTATGVGGSVSNILTLRGGAGNDSLTGNAAGARTFFFASPGNDSVTGLGTDNFLFSADANGTADSTWNITAPNSGTLTFPGATTTFSGVQNLYGGGSGSATFVFADGAGVDGNISGSSLGGSTNTLDYRAYSTSVIVDLQTGFATGVGGSVTGITVVFGGTGNGALGAYNLLIGNGGNVLTGGFDRRNILVAGGTASTLNGGNQDDLLIGGSSPAYDIEPGLVSWLQIAGYWAGTDDFNTRVFNLTNGNGVPRLDASTVTGNGGGNTLNGTGELAWIFTDGADFLNGPFDPASQFVHIDP